MKKIITNSIYIILFLGLWACDQDEFFEIKRPQETQWVSTVTFDQGLSAAYYDVLYVGALPSIVTFMDFATSGVGHLLPETSTGAPWNQLNYRLFDQNFGFTDNIWASYYKAVTMCNLAIQLDEENDGNPFALKTDGSDYMDNYVRQVGEYYFLRAYSYYILVRTFAPPYNHTGSNDGTFIPFKTKASSSAEEIHTEALGSNEEIYQQIIDDLKVAKEKLPLAYNSSTMFPTYQVGRANKYVASAMLAKVYFVMGKYSEAKQELDFVINAAEQDGLYSLEEPIQAFNKNVMTNIPKESIWEFNAGDVSNWMASSYMYWGMIYNLNFRDADNGGRGVNMVKSPWCQFTLSYWAIDKMNWMNDPLNGDYSLTNEAINDLRFQQLYYYLLGYNASGDPLLYETVNGHSKVVNPQIYFDKIFRGGPGDGRYTKFPLIRLADLYLIRSWINWKANSAANAASDLNKVWNRANPGNPDRYNAGNVNHDVILAEYLKEISGEGWSLDFMVGTQMDIPPGDEDRAAIAPPYSVWKWTIPASERSLNPNFQ